MPTLTITSNNKHSVHQEQAFYHAFLFSLCFLLGAVGGTVSTLMSVYLPVAVRELLAEDADGDLNAISGYINALFIYGWAIGGFCWGLFCDRAGRKRGLLLAAACYGIFTVATGMMPHWWGLLICRFFSGFGVGGVLVVSFTLLAEVWPSKSRAVYMGILSISFPIGIFSAGLINYFVASWRQGFLIGLIPLALALLGAWLLQESPAWREQKRQERTAPIQQVFEETTRYSLLLGSLMFGCMLIGLWAIFSWLPSWVQTMAATTDAQKERGLSMMFLGMGGLLGGFCSGWIVNRLGSRRSMVLCFGLSALFSLLLFRSNQGITSLLFIETAFLAFVFGVSQGVLSSFIPALFPTRIRASATGVCFNVGRLVTATAVLFVGVLLTAAGGLGNALTLFSFVFIAGLLIVLFLKKPQAEGSRADR